jgi:hypothetical protein
LVRVGNFRDAILTGVDFYLGNASKVVTGLPIESEAREKAVRSYLGDLILSYVNMSISSFEVGVPLTDDDQQQIRQLFRLVFEASITIGQEDIIYNSIYEECVESGLQGYYLEELEPFLLQEKISLIESPFVYQSYFEYFSTNGWMDRLEQIILRIQPGAIDINKTSIVCRKYGLYLGLIYTYNQALSDFVTPLIDLLALVESRLSAGRRAVTEDGDQSSKCYTLFVYLAYLLTGKAFPKGTLAKKDALLAKTDIYNFLFSQTYVKWDHANYPGHEIVLGQLPYPYLTVLLRYDSSELFKALSLAFDDPSLDGEVRVRGGYALDGKVRFADEHEAFDRQYIIEGLLDLASKDPPRMAPIYVFVAKMCGRYPKAISLSDNQLGAIIDVLVDSTEPTGDGLEREAAILGILPLYSKLRNFANGEAFAEKCKAASLWQVSEIVYRKLEKYDCVVECYLRDENRKNETFRCLRELLGSENLTYAQTWTLKEFILSNIADIIELDAWETAAMISTVFPGDSKEVVERLHALPGSLYKYLRGCLELSPAANYQKQYFSLRQSQAPNAFSNDQIDIHVRNHEQWMYDLYITLKMKVEPGMVLSYLQAIANDVDNELYDYKTMLDQALQLGLHKVALWIMERHGDIGRCLNLIVSNINQTVVATRNENDPRNQSAAHVLSEWIGDAINLCKRHSKQHDVQSTETLWFTLFDNVLKCYSDLSYDKNTEASHNEDKTTGSPICIKDILKSHIIDIIISMVGYVSLPSIFSRFLQIDHGEITMSSYRDSILSMLTEASLEIELLSIATKIIAADAHKLNVQRILERRHGLRPGKGTCGICRKWIHLSDGDVDISEEAILHACRHIYHKSCLLKTESDQSSPPSTLPLALNHNCPLCEPSKSLRLQYLRSAENQLITKANVSLVRHLNIQH